MSFSKNKKPAALIHESAVRSLIEQASL